MSFYYLFRFFAPILLTHSFPPQNPEINSIPEIFVDIASAIYEHKIPPYCVIMVKKQTGVSCISVTVADCLKLPSLREANIVAGFEGLNNVVVSVSVLEYAVPSALTGNYFQNNEIVITAFISIKDDVEAQCATIRLLHEVGEVGLILYYIGVYLPELDERLIQTANELGFPLICMPYKRCDLRYSEVICDIMEAIFKDQTQKTYFVGEMLDRILQLTNRQRNMDTVLRMLSDRIRSTLLLTDRVLNILNVAAWPMSASVYAHEAIDYYKAHPSILNDSRFRKIQLNDKAFHAGYQLVTVESGMNLNLILLNEAGSVPSDSCRQAAEVVRLFISIWSHNEGNVGSDELVRAILNDEPVKMRRLAEIMHIDIASIHTMWVIKSKNGNPAIDEQEQMARNTRLLIKLRQYLQEQRRLAVVDIFEGNVVAFMDNPAFADEINPLAAGFIKELSMDLKDVKLAICTDLENTTEVRAAYVLLETHLKDARIIYPHKDILTYHEILFASTCSDIIHKGEEEVAKSLLPLKSLRLDDRDQENALITTLSTYMLDTQANVEFTAQLLFIHKSTVKYRINKINERLNYSVLKLPESYKLYVALAIERLLSGLS